MNSKTKEYREKLTRSFIEVLKEDQLDWKRGWKIVGKQRNGKTNAAYRGMNQFYLRMIAKERGYEDPRWVTFHQCKENGWQLQDAKGQGVLVEYWFPYDREEKRGLSWQEFRDQKLELDDRYGLRAVYTHVFNAELVQGIPELELEVRQEHSLNEVIQKLEQNMGVPILNDGEDRAYYEPSRDQIHLPKAERFHSDYEYNATALHELSHATGAKHRLDRNIQNSFGTDAYAKEELVAEITASFIAAELPIEQTEYHVANHKAYVQSWIEVLQKDPDLLAKSIAQAELAANYLEEMAELIPVQEKKQEFFMEVPEKNDMKNEQLSAMEQCMKKSAEKAVDFRKHQEIER